MKTKNRKYYVTFRIDARYTAEIEAGCLEDAEAIARNQICEADFGQAEDVDSDIIIVTDDCDNYLYEK